MGRAAAKTGSGPTAIVAIEQYFPADQRIITDELAYSILPLGVRIFLRLMRSNGTRDWMLRMAEKNAPGLWSLMVCRKRYIDDKVLESAGNVGAVVNLGAGFDTRVYRMNALAQLPAWEADQSQNIHAKQKRLRAIFGAVPERVNLVAIDFDHEDLGAALTARGFSSGIPAFYIWEAVTQYLTDAAVRGIFDFLAKAAKGSRLVFTYVRKDFIEGKCLYGQKDMYARYIEKNKVWLYGMNPEEVADFLSSYGWRLVEDVDYAALVARYVEPTGRRLLWTPIERIVFAEKS